jgi:hypothetical protein
MASMIEPNADAAPLDGFATWQEQTAAVEEMDRAVRRDWFRALGLNR